MEHQLVRISSRDRTRSTDSTTDFTVSLGNVGIQNVSSLVVKQASFANVFYNVNEYNRTFTYNIASAPTSVTIPVGQYTLSDFLTAFETATSALTMTATQDATTLKIDFASTTAIEYLPIGNNPMAELLGITTGSGADVTTFTSEGLPSLEGEKNAFIKSLQLSQSNLMDSDAKHDNTLVVVPINVGFGSIQHYVSQHSAIDDVDSPSSIHGNNIQEIGIRLTDDQDRTLDLNGHHLTIILKAYFG